MNLVRQKIVLIGASLCMFASTAPAYGQALQDPTKPPAALERESENGAAPAAPVLQSILISPGRTMATVNGRMVKVGDRVGEARVVRISETEVVLRNGGSVETLKLFPGMEKRRSAGAVTAGREQ